MNNRLPSISRILERLDAMPPFFVYYAGAHSNRTFAYDYKKRRGNKSSKRLKSAKGRLSLRELSRLSGIPNRTIYRIVSQISWENVTVKHVEPFCRACGVNILSPKYLKAYVRQTMQSQRPFAHLTNQQLERFKSLSARYLKLKEERESNRAAAEAPSPESPIE